MKNPINFNLMDNPINIGEGADLLWNLRMGQKVKREAWLQILRNLETSVANIIDPIVDAVEDEVREIFEDEQ